MAEDQCTVIVAYEVNAEDGDKFLNAWEKAQKHLRKQPGFVSTSLYKAESAAPHFRFVNVAEWENADHFRSATQSTKFHEASGLLAAYPLYASVYNVVRS